MPTKWILLAARIEDTEFWSLLGVLIGLDVMAVEVADVEELVVSLKKEHSQPSALVVCADLARGNAGAMIRRLKTVTDAPLIVASNSSDRELERTARAAGIFYYLLLPAEGEHARMAVERAMQSCETHTETRQGPSSEVDQ